LTNVQAPGAMGESRQVATDKTVECERRIGASWPAFSRTRVSLEFSKTIVDISPWPSGGTTVLEDRFVAGLSCSLRVIAFWGDFD